MEVGVLIGGNVLGFGLVGWLVAFVCRSELGTDESE